MSLNRRSFLKSTALFTFISTGLAPLTSAIAAALKDAKVKRQGYLHDVTKATKAQLSKIKKYTKSKTATFTPMCSNCKFYKKPKDGYGICTMVGATGKPGKFVYEKGICKVYAKKK